jgi:hypothetical protein
LAEQTQSEHCVPQGRFWQNKADHAARGCKLDFGKTNPNRKTLRFQQL